MSTPNYKRASGLGARHLNAVDLLIAGPTDAALQPNTSLDTSAPSFRSIWVVTENASSKAPS